MKAALLEAGKEGSPMDFCFAQSHAHAEDGAFAIGPNAQGNEHGAVEDLATLTDFFIAGIDKDIAAGFERAGAPAFEFCVEPGGALTDLSGADGVPAELFDDGGNFAGGNALHIHFGQRQFEGLLAADAFLQGRGIEVQIAADLGNLKLDEAGPGGQGFGFKAVGMAEAVVGAFIGLGLEGLAAFLAHGFID